MNTAPKFKTWILSIVMGLPALAFSANIEGEKNDDGSFKKWHRIEAVFDGPQGTAPQPQPVMDEPITPVGDEAPPEHPPIHE